MSVHGVVSYQMHIEKQARDRLRCVVELAGDGAGERGDYGQAGADGRDPLRLGERPGRAGGYEAADGYVPKAKVIVDHREQYD